VNGFFICENITEGSGDMNKLIARLIDCGMPREVALAVYRSFKRRNQLFDFEHYVESVEEECHEPMEAV
jgi:hypothetical protein